MARLKTKLQSFSLLYVIVPLLTVLLYYLINLYQQKMNEYQNDLISFREGAARNVSLEINQTERAFSTFSALPQVSRVLGGASAARQKLDSSKITVEQFLQMIQRGEDISSPRIAEISPQQLVNNPATDRFRIMLEEHPEMVDFVLSDNLGNIIAASAATVDRKNVASTAWWRTAFNTRRMEVLYEPRVDDNGRFGMFSAIWDDSSGELLPLGAIRMTIDLNALMDTLENYPRESGDAIMAMNASSWFHAVGDASVISGAAQPIFGEINTRFQRMGWFANTHFSGQQLDPRFRIGEQDQLLLVALRRDPLTPSHILHTIMLAAVLSLIALGMIGVLAWLSVHRLAQANETTLDAGLWLMHRMRGESAVPASSIAYLAKTPIGQEIQNWEEGYRNNITEDVQAHAFESMRDLELAHDFQMAYLNRPYPKVPAVPAPGRLSLRFYHRYKPALALGGDFFDIFTLSQETAGLFIADVMGHGTRSALITSILRTLLTDHKPQGRNARNFLRELNRSFCALIKQVRMDHPLFASAFYFVADTTARAATFSSAGHPPPFLLRGSTGSIERLQVAEPKGAALGILPEEEYTGGSCRLYPGDIFLFFTDGAYECFNTRGDEFGMAGMEASLKRLMHQGVTHTVDGLMEAIGDFTAAAMLRDDICIVGIEVVEELSAVEKSRTGRIQVSDALPES